VTSNGSTAIVPPTPLPSQAYPVPSDFESKDLPSSPPPPPVKSARRSERAAMGSQQSKSQRELARNDSLHSQGEAERTRNEDQAVANNVPEVKRKALPAPTAKKFMSLAALGTGPRGGKGGPLPPTSAPRKRSVDSPASEPREEALPVNDQQRNRSTRGELPPTPDEEKNTTAAPAPPRKVFTAIGLPSNPRARAPPSPLHVRGKSSTGFDLLKVRISIQFPSPVFFR
jgi:hypothetical protein